MNNILYYNNLEHFQNTPPNNTLNQNNFSPSQYPNQNNFSPSPSKKPTLIYKYLNIDSSKIKESNHKDYSQTIVSTFKYQTKDLKNQIIFYDDKLNLVKNDNIKLNISPICFSCSIKKENFIEYKLSIDLKQKLTNKNFNNDDIFNNIIIQENNNYYIKITIKKEYTDKSIYNIPLKFLNNYHKLNNDDTNTKKIVIDLPIKFDDSISGDIQSIKIVVDIYIFGGLPLYKINNIIYPIVDKTSNKYTISIGDDFGNNGKFGKFELNTATGISTIDTTIDNTIISKNNYKYETTKINNVVNIDVISSKIPHTQLNIYENQKINGITNSTNNKLYYSYIHNSKSHTDNISIPEGYYNINSLSKKIMNDIQDKYHKLHDDIICKINYSLNENKIEFEFFKEEIFTCEIDFDESSSIFLNDIINLKIYHQNNNFKSYYDKVGENMKISITKAPETTLQLNNIIKTHEIKKDNIKDNYYIIQIMNENYIIDINSSTFGSDTIKRDFINSRFKVKIIYPVLFQLDFSHEDTFGNLIGFRTNSPIFITDYNFKISNTSLYPYNNIHNNQNESIKTLPFIDYNLNSNINIFLRISFPQLSKLTTNDIYNDNNHHLKLAIIQLNRLNQYVYNNHINISSSFKQLDVSNIEFSFVNLDNSLYNFNNHDHNFTLKFTCIN